MSNERKPLASLVTGIRPERSDRAIILDIARVVDVHTRMLVNIAEEQGNQTTWRGQFQPEWKTFQHDFAELKGHVMRADSQGRQASSHDLEQDARIAQLDERVEVVETGWRLVGSRIAAFIDHPRTRQVAKIIWVAAVAYAGAKGLKVLP